jgi:hypothetical protein
MTKQTEKLLDEKAFAAAIKNDDVYTRHFLRCIIEAYEANRTSNLSAEHGKEYAGMKFVVDESIPEGEAHFKFTKGSNQPNLSADGDAIKINEVFEKAYDRRLMERVIAAYDPALKTSIGEQQPNLSALDSDEAVEQVMLDMWKASRANKIESVEKRMKAMAKAAIQAVKEILQR